MPAVGLTAMEEQTIQKQNLGLYPIVFSFALQYSATTDLTKNDISFPRILYAAFNWCN